jgi:hypothetical protein
MLHQGRIAQADRAVAQRVPAVSAVCALSSWLVVDADDYEAIICNRIYELLLLNFDRVER